MKKSNYWKYDQNKSQYDIKSSLVSKINHHNQIS